MIHSEKVEKLAELSNLAIKRLRELPAPVVRVSGPLTSGGFGYEENLSRFKFAQEKLKAQGYTVFDYFEGHHDESQIVDLHLPWEEVMKYYHQPILETGLIDTMFMMPNWRESNGSKRENELAKKVGIKVRHIPASWFE